MTLTLKTSYPLNWEQYARRQRGTKKRAATDDQMRKQLRALVQEHGAGVLTPNETALLARLEG